MRFIGKIFWNILQIFLFLLKLPLLFFLFLFDSVLTPIFWLISVFGFRQPTIWSALRFATVLIFAYVIATAMNRQVARDWSNFDQLITPVMLESNNQKIGGFNVGFGFTVSGSEQTDRGIGSEFVISNDVEELFSLKLYSLTEYALGNGFFDPAFCTSANLVLPSKGHLISTLGLDAKDLAQSVRDSQAIYKICQFDAPFKNVIEPKLMLDRQSLLELMKQELDAAIEVAGQSKENSSQSESGDSDSSGEETSAQLEGASGEEEPKAKLSLADLDDEHQTIIKDVYFQRFLSAPGILGQTVANTEIGPIVEGSCASMLETSWICESKNTILSLLEAVGLKRSSQTTATLQRNDDVNCGQDDSLLDRICDVQSDMFANGRIQFVSLVVFCFGLIQLSLLFTIGVVGAYWVRIGRQVGGFWASTSPTMLNRFIDIPRFHRIYNELSAPVSASVDILPMIGFFGTIIGISGAMTEVAGVKSTDKLVEVLALGSMTTNIGIAFETTKYALILSAVLLLLKLMTDRAQALSEEVEE